MAKLIIAIVKVLLALTVIAAIGIGALLLARHQGWPDWSALVAVAIALAFLLFIVFLRRYYFRRRERAFVKRIVDQDKEAIDALPARERQRFLDLQERWTAAVATLRAAPRLRKGGNPLYSLPWFMVMGETESGKSSAIAASSLPTILTEAGPAKGIGGTRNCDWWFFEDSVVIDTAGRYVVSDDQEDRLEWEGFLTLLVKYRRREPLNGLIICLPADKLLADDTDALADYGRAIRRRIDQLMRVLGTRFPVYFLITKADLVFGTTGLAELLSPKELAQPLGVLNDDPNERPERFAKSALEGMIARLKELRLRFLGDEQHDVMRAAMFPAELERLAPRIEVFVTAAFHETPYLETPFLRGIFLSSARQSGSVRSLLLTGLTSIGDASWRLGDGKVGLFLHDLFATILPRDRRAFKRIREYRRWRNTSAGLAMIVWGLLIGGAVGIATLSYLHVRDALKPMSEVVANQSDLGKDLGSDMDYLGSMRRDILITERVLNGGDWPWPNFLFPQGQAAVADLKQRFVELFREYLLNPTDKAMSDKYWSYEIDAKKQSVAGYIEYLIWRVQIIDQKYKKAPPSQSDSPAPVEVLATSFQGHLPYVIGTFPAMYRSYVQWETNEAILESEAKEMKAIAAHLIDQEAADLHWLVGWAEEKISLNDVTLGLFWQGLGAPDPTIRVPAAYTAEGKQHIEGLIAQLQLVVPKDASFAPRVDAFWQWYAGQYVSAWAAFARNFSDGFSVLLTQRDWTNVAATMPTVNNPYFKLMDRMRKELQAIKGIGQPLPLAKQLDQFNNVVLAYEGAQKGAKLGKLLTGAEEKVGSTIPGSFDATDAAKDLSKYLEQISAMLPATQTTDGAFRLASTSFGAVPGDKDASAPEVAVATASLITQKISPGYQDEDVFSGLLTGPLYFLANLVIKDAACAIDQLWSVQVVGDAAGLAQYQLWEHLFGQDGTVKAFTSGPAKPFLNQTSAGWQAKSWQGVAFPFHDDFLAFLAQGQVRREKPRSSYHATINALPTNVNKGAKSEPFQTRLVLNCGGKTQVLNNFNYPNALSFSWGPNECGDAELSIYFPEATLVYAWDGAEGFLRFLREFKGGNKQFTPADFPSKQSILQGLGVTSITVNYAIKNAGPIMGVVQYPKLNLPAQAADCWSEPVPRIIDTSVPDDEIAGESPGDDSPSLGSEP